MDNLNIVVADLKSQMDAQTRSLEEIKTSQTKIAAALLGSLDTDSIGLIEQVRNQQKKIEELAIAITTSQAQIALLLTFRTEIKKIVAGIAFAIPILWDVIKGVAQVGWNYFTNHK